MTAQARSTDPPSFPRSLLVRLAVLAACACSAALVGAMAIRPITSVDLGYHLAYGERLLDTGRIVRDDSFIHPAIAPGDFHDEPLPPGARFDSEGRYRFANANWLTQLILAKLWRVGGWRAMNISLVVLVALLAGGQALVLRRLGASAAWLPVVWLATAVLAQERFMLRPELPAYVCLMAQLWLLCGRGRITWRRIVACLAVQLLAANLHSYWLLGVGVAGAFALDAALRAVWIKAVQARQLDVDLRHRLIRLLVCVAAMFAVAAIHPDGARNAALPFQTLDFMRAYDIAGATSAEVSKQWRDRTINPWQAIAEFHSPLEPKAWRRMETWVFAGGLTVAAVAAATLAWRRRWGPLFVIVGLTAVSITMRRNVAIFALFVTPVLTAATAAVKPKRAGWWFGVAVAGQIAALAVAAWLLVSVFTDGYYVHKRVRQRFAWGASQLDLPLGPCRWLDEHLPAAQPAFTDQPSSSTCVFFSRKITAAPCLTNTWATPVRRYAQVIELGAGDPATRRPDLNLLSHWGIDVAVLRAWPIHVPLIKALVDSPNWAMVYTETWFVVFVRRTPANADLIAASEITRENLNTAAFIERCRQSQATESLALEAGASTLHHLGWLDKAEPLWRACLATDRGARFHEAWLNLGVCLATNGQERLKRGDAGGLAALREARECFEKALELKSDYRQALRNLRMVGKDIRRFTSIGR